jgi:hypothetical protein
VVVQTASPELVRGVGVYLPDQLEEAHLDPAHSLFVIDLDDEDLLPYAMSIVGSKKEVKDANA